MRNCCRRLSPSPVTVFRSVLWTFCARNVSLIRLLSSDCASDGFERATKIIFLLKSSVFINSNCFFHSGNGLSTAGIFCLSEAKEERKKNANKITCLPLSRSMHVQNVNCLRFLFLFFSFFAVPRHRIEYNCSLDY